jgi:UTP-glucose-1-phosphate uridylyltransferase
MPCSAPARRWATSPLPCCWPTTCSTATPLPVMKQMVDVYDYYRSSVIGVQQVAREETKSYGIVDSKPISEHLETIQRIVEKPKPEEAPSTLAWSAAMS